MVVIASSVTIEFYISTFLLQDFRIKLSFVPEFPQSVEYSSHSFACNGVNDSVTMAGIEIITICFAGRVNVTVINVTDEALGEYTVSINVNETVGDTAFSNLKLVSAWSVFYVYHTSVIPETKFNRVPWLRLKSFF